MRKYYMSNLTCELPDGRILYRVIANRDFGNVKKGTAGGFIGDTRNLSQDGDCWVADDAAVYGAACVSANAWVGGKATIKGRALITDSASVLEDALIDEYAFIGGHARIKGETQIGGKSLITGRACITGTACFYDQIFSGDQYVTTRDGFLHVSTY